MVAAVTAPIAAPGPQPPGVSSDVPGPGPTPFVRAAAPQRTRVIQSTPATTWGVNETQVPIQLEGTGYWCALDLTLTVTSSGQNATVAAAEDAPWSAFSSVVVSAGGPQNINVNGYALYLLNIYGGYQFSDLSLSTDTNVFSALTTGAGGTAGSGSFTVMVPIAINERSYIGLQGNQDRGTKYQVNDNVAGTASVWTTPPNGTLTFAIGRHYHYLPVPPATGADGRQQEVRPSYYTIVHYLQSVRTQAVPAGGSTVNHYLTNLANACRTIILIFRSNGSRSTAQTNAPTQIDFFLGTDDVFSETYAERRRIMRRRYGFDAPNGVLVYDFIHDFGPISGYEIGDQYVYLGNLSEVQFRVVYPSGFGSTNNSLEVVTDSLFIPPGIDIYSVPL